MKYRAIALAAGLLAAHTAANAWFFFFLPGSVTSAISDTITGSEGEHCIPGTAKVGDRINIGGAVFEVKSLSGTSTRCTNPTWPIRAKLEAVTDQSAAASMADNAECVESGVGPGDRMTRPGKGQVHVVRIIGRSSSCTISEMPYMAEVAPVLQAQAPKVAAPEPAAPVAVSLPAQAMKSTADRLRDLKSLRDQDLITPEVYESQQRRVLSDQ